MTHDQAINFYFTIISTNLSKNRPQKEQAHGFVITVSQSKTASTNEKNHQSVKQKAYYIGFVLLIYLKLQKNYIDVSIPNGWMDDKKNVDAKTNDKKQNTSKWLQKLKLQRA